MVFYIIEETLMYNWYAHMYVYVGIYILCILYAHGNVNCIADYTIELLFTW